MYSVSYPALLKRDINRDGFVVNLPDLPEALTDGRNLTDALNEAADCLREALAGRMVRREDIPSPSRPQRGQYMIPVALYLAPKLALYVTMREKGMTSSELARRLKCAETMGRRMLNPRYDAHQEV